MLIYLKKKKAHGLLFKSVLFYRLNRLDYMSYSIASNSLAAFSIPWNNKNYLSSKIIRITLITPPRTAGSTMCSFLYLASRRPFLCALSDLGRDDTLGWRRLCMHQGEPTLPMQTPKTSGHLFPNRNILGRERCNYLMTGWFGRSSRFR